MNVTAIVVESLMCGLTAVVLWVVIWAVAFSEMWTGYSNHILEVFWLSFVAYLVLRASPMMFGRK